MSDKEIFSLQGIIKRKLQDKQGTSSSGTPYTRRTFILKQENGQPDLFITTFQKFDNQFVGKYVEFEATKYNETSYTLAGELRACEVPITKSESEIEARDVQVPSEPEAEPAKKSRRRGRPAKNQPVKEALSTARPGPGVVGITDTRESFREVAIESTRKDLQSAIVLAKELHLDTSDTAGLIAVADRIGRTMSAIEIGASKV